jgi:uncharacterized damage-inducible protein DinB
LNGHWIANTNFKEQLLKLNWEQAVAKFENLNTIAALTFHVNYYLSGVVNVFQGGGLEIRDKYSFDLHPITSEDEWETLRESLFRNAEVLAQSVENIPDEKLNEIFVDEKYGTYLRNIEGMIEHSYYHLGQISLLAKLLKNR